MPSDPESSALGGTLLLEDGTRFDGEGFGAAVARVGEVVFTTGMVGYPESLTDPSYRGQILTFTYPLLGNYGVPGDELDQFGLPAHFESSEVQVRGVLVRGTTDGHHWAQTSGLDAWMRRFHVPGVRGIDTRRLTEHLRTRGVVRGVVSVHPKGRAPNNDDLARRMRSAPQYGQENYFPDVSVRAPTLYEPDGGRSPVVGVLDCGVKASIVRALLSRGVGVLRIPFDQTVPDRWEGRRVRGLLVGNGPGDPEQLPATIEELGRPSHRELPTLGICLGHQLLALSRGATTFKLKYGHRGQNKTIVFPDGRALIVSENHGFAVRPESLSRTGFRPWATNPDDGTLEGFRDARGRVLALQGHPEGHPGPQEASFVFDRFVEKVRRRAA